MKNLLFPAVIVCLLCSCGSSSSNERFNNVPYAPAPAAAQQNAPAPGPAKLVSDTLTPQAAKTSQPAPNVTIQTNSKDLVIKPVAQAAPPAAVANGLNPAHGQPGAPLRYCRGRAIKLTAQCNCNTHCSAGNHPGAARGYQCGAAG